MEQAIGGRSTPVLLRSPLVGPLTWRGVNAHLAATGFEVVAPDVTQAVNGKPPCQQTVADTAATSLTTRATDTPVVLVGHCGTAVVGDSLEHLMRLVIPASKA